VVKKSKSDIFCTLDVYLIASNKRAWDKSIDRQAVRDVDLLYARLSQNTAKSRLT